MSTTKFESRVIKCASDVVLAYKDHKRAIDDNSGMPVQARYLKKLTTALTALEVGLSALSRDNDKKSQAKARAAQRRREEEEEAGRVPSRSVDYTGMFKTVIDIAEIFNKSRRSGDIVEGEVID